MKKILKGILYTILIVLGLAIVISTISYSSYEAKDISTQIDTNNLKYYHETYEECRAQFIADAIELTFRFDSVQSGSFPVESKIDNDLSVDWCYIPAQKKKSKLVVITSGLHGIEGYTGSAIQAMFIEKLAKQQSFENIGVLFIHALNPYGFKYRRKVTENNIDLNRNCVKELAEYNGKNTGFAQLDDLLMPIGPTNMSSLKNRFFHLVAIKNIIQESMPVLRQAALQGQYQFDKGIYYGGKSREPQIKKIEPLLIEKMNQYKMVLNLDLHTAYGKRGKLHLFLNPVKNQKVAEALNKIFAEADIDWGSGEDFYTINGEYVEWANNLLPNILCVPMLFEFGTMDSQKTYGSLKSIQYMITENQGVHYGYKNEKTESLVKQNFDKMYYPTSMVWRSKVISDSYHQMNIMMKNLEEYPIE